MNWTVNTVQSNSYNCQNRITHSTTAVVLPAVKLYQTVCSPIRYDGDVDSENEEMDMKIFVGWFGLVYWCLTALSAQTSYIMP